MIRKIQKLLIFLGFNLIIVALIFFLCEGLASFILFLQTVTVSPPVAERRHTQYDETLGWVNRPNLSLTDLYGPGLDLHTNSQGFRNRKDFSREVPPGKIRVICSGDSFTLGYGVGDEQTWCRRLAALDERLQPVNMGQGGYGVGQAYLWYKRDGTHLDHHIHLFAVTATDFERMQATEFLGYGKPRLDVVEGELVVDNTPPPKRAFYIPWLTHNREAIQGLTSVQLLGQLFQQTEDPQAAGRPVARAAPEAVAAEVLKDLLRLNAAKDSRLVLVYLPTLGDYHQLPDQSAAQVWRDFLELAAKDTGVVYIDLLPAFREVPPDRISDLFIPEGAVDFPGAAGHYSVEGNRFVAERLYEALLARPEVSTRLAGKGR